MSDFTLMKVIIFCAVSTVTLQGAIAQSYSPEPMDNLSQVDITQGMAEQSAMHAMRAGYVPTSAMNSAPPFGCVQQQGPLQGSASQNYNTLAASQQFGFQGAAGQNSNNGQNYNAVPLNQQAQSFQECGALQGNNCNSNMQCQNPGSAHGINQQMVGVVGAALLMNYAAYGGMANVLGEMRSRSFNNRFRSFGPSMGGNQYH